MRGPTADRHTMHHDLAENTNPQWPRVLWFQAQFSGYRTVPLQPVGGVGHKPGVGDVLLMNPSVAGWVRHPTLIKTGQYARAWGYGGQTSTPTVNGQPSARGGGRPGRPEKMQRLLHGAPGRGVVLAYGLPPSRCARAAAVVQILRRAAPLQYPRDQNEVPPSVVSEGQPAALGDFVA